MVLLRRGIYVANEAARVLARLLPLVTVVLVVSILAIAAARRVGRGMVTPTYLQTGPDCAQPCWYGLRPGENNIHQFLYHAREFTPFSARTSDTGDGVATMFELSVFGALRLGDVVRVLGPPEQVGCLGLDHTALFPGTALVMSARLYWGGGLVVVTALRSDSLAHLSPDMYVRTIRYYAPGESLAPIGTTTGWHGFAAAVPYRLCHPQQR